MSKEGRHWLVTSEEEDSHWRRSHVFPRIGAWETGQIPRSARVAHALSFPTTGLDGFARRRPAVTPMGAVTPHSPSR